MLYNNFRETGDIMNAKEYKTMAIATLYGAVATALCIQAERADFKNKIEEEVGKLTYTNFYYNEIDYKKLYFVTVNNRMEICMKRVLEDGTNVYYDVNFQDNIIVTTNDSKSDIIVEPVVEYLAEKIISGEITEEEAKGRLIQDRIEEYNDNQIKQEKLKTKKFTNQKNQ